MIKIFFSVTAITIIVLLFTLQVSVSSCEKEVLRDTVTVVKEKCPPSIMGLWIGTYTADLLPNDPAKYYSFIIKPGGTMVVESHPLNTSPFFAVGTWNLNGNILTCDFTYPAAPQGYPVRQTATSIYDSTNGKLNSGVWQNIGSPTGTGKFTMSRVNN